MAKYEFKKNGQTLELTNISGIDGFGFPPVDVASEARGWRVDGSRVQHTAYMERPFTFTFDISEGSGVDMMKERSAIYRFFADKQPASLECTIEDQLYVLDDVYLAGDSGHRMHETPVMTVILQFVAGDPFFKREILQNWVALGSPISLANEGDLEVRPQITIRGELTSVSVVRGAYSATVNKEIATGEYIEINDGIWYIESDGTRHNAYPDSTVESRPIWLAKGDNTIVTSVAGTGEIKIEGFEKYASL